MAQDDIQGQVVDAQGNPVDGAIVELTKSYQSNPADEQVVLRTTTDSNGEYRFFYHPDGDDTTQEWHVSAYSHDGTAYVNSFNNPGVTAELRSNAIPDSVVAQYFATSYTQGDATWQDQATSDGAQDVSLSGDPQPSSLSDGADAIAFDTSDHGLHTVPVSGSDLNSFSLEFALSWTHDRDEIAYGGVDSQNGQFFQLRINIDESFGSDPGNFYFRIRDTDSNQLGVSLDGAPSLNDGARHDIIVRVNDASQNDIDVIIDGALVSVNKTPTNNPSNYGSWDTQTAIAANNNSGTIVLSSEVDYGAVRWHDSAIAEQTIDDYP